MGLKRTTGLVLALLFIWILCISLLRENLGVSIRLFNDDYDRGIYAEHGKWLQNGEVPSGTSSVNIRRFRPICLPCPTF